MASATAKMPCSLACPVDLRRVQCLVEENDIGIGVAANDGELLSIRRPVEITNLFGSEIRYRVTLRAVERLHPNVPHAIFDDGIGQRLVIRREFHAASNIRVERNDANRGLRSLVVASSTT